jgi:hypothetical protein
MISAAISADRNEASPGVDGNFKFEGCSLIELQPSSSKRVVATLRPLPPEEVGYQHIINDIMSCAGTAVVGVATAGLALSIS